MARTSVCVSLLLLALCACAMAVETHSAVPQLFTVEGSSSRKLMQGFGNAWGVPPDYVIPYGDCRVNVMDATDCRRGEVFACCDEGKSDCTGIKSPWFKCKAWTYNACCKAP